MITETMKTDWEILDLAFQVTAKRMEQVMLLWSGLTTKYPNADAVRENLPQAKADVQELINHLAHVTAPEGDVLPLATAFSNVFFQMRQALNFIDTDIQMAQTQRQAEAAAQKAAEEEERQARARYDELKALEARFSHKSAQTHAAV